MKGSFPAGLAHVLGGAAVVLASLAFTTLGYLGVLAWALAVGEPLGGALALPFLLLVALVISASSVLLILAPATLLARWFCRRAVAWATPAEIPVALVLQLLLAVAWATLLGWVAEWEPGESARWGLLAGLSLLVPLGLYWSVVRSAQWSLTKTAHLGGKIRGAWSRAPGPAGEAPGTGGAGRSEP